MSNIRESEILHTNEEGESIATSYDPGAFSNDTVRVILRNQISSPNPIEIHCLKNWHYATIEASDFKEMRNASEQDKEDFIKEGEKLIKDLQTKEIIFATPLIPRAEK
jgi:hypothetical protein